jgi:membrane fusion protein (multidrug efflux system)
MYRKQEWDSTPTRFKVVPADQPGQASDTGAAEGADSEQALSIQPAAEQTVPATAPQSPAIIDEPVAVAPKAAARLSVRNIALGAFAAAAAIAAAWFGYDWWTIGRFTVSTEDAYVRAYNTTLAAKVPGYVASVLVTDNTAVHAGDVIATIDDGDYRLAADSAREKAATQEATIERLGQQIEAQKALIAQAQAQIDSTKADVERTGLDLTRASKLAKSQ